MLKDVVNRVKNELEDERKNREYAEENLLNLLEETCNKLNNATSYWGKFDEKNQLFQIKNNF